MTSSSASSVARLWAGATPATCCVSGHSDDGPWRAPPCSACRAVCARHAAAWRRDLFWSTDVRLPASAFCACVAGRRSAARASRQAGRASSAGSTRTTAPAGAVPPRYGDRFPRAGTAQASMQLLPLRIAHATGTRTVRPLTVFRSLAREIGGSACRATLIPWRFPAQTHSQKPKTTSVAGFRLAQ